MPLSNANGRGISYKNPVKGIVSLIEKGNAHATLDDALNNIPFSLLVQKPWNLPYSIWQVAEHIRIAQWDIRNFHEMQNISRPNGPMDIGQRKKSRFQKMPGKNVLIQLRQTARHLLNWFKMQAALWIKFLNMVMAKAS